MYYTSWLFCAVTWSHCMYIKPDTFSVQHHIHIVSMLTPNISLKYVLLSNVNKIASYLECLFLEKSSCEPACFLYNFCIVLQNWPKSHNQYYLYYSIPS